jgi:hypothetical protein
MTTDDTNPDAQIGEQAEALLREWYPERVEVGK